MGSLDFAREKETIGVKLFFLFSLHYHHLCLALERGMYGKEMKEALGTGAGLTAWLVFALQCL